MTRIATLLIGLLLLFQVKPINPNQPLDVCQVMGSLQRYRGEIIKVRGEWNGQQLRGTCADSLKSGDYVWPNAFYLGNSSDSLEDPPNSKDTEAWNRALDQLWAARRPLRATITGRLETRDKLELMESGYPAGYGHLGEFPAQLVIVTIEVEDVTGK